MSAHVALLYTTLPPIPARAAKTSPGLKGPGPASEGEAVLK